jgi:molecular chaperone DnaJ
MANNKDYYKTLGVEKNASKDEIKKAFHKLAHQYHPDKKGGDEAKFKEINEAYQTLSDDQKRTQYDQFGSAYSGGGGNGGGFGGQNGFDFSNFTNGQGFDFGDIFGDFFGGGRTQERRGRDISVDIQITFAESIFGVDRKVLISKIGVCDTCKGSGAAVGSKMKKCPTCNGQGQVNETRHSFLGTFTTTKECEKCHGKGEIPESACRDCGGVGVKKKSEEIQFVIPAGISHGEMIRLSGKGEAIPGGMSGDLYVRIHIESHPLFKREGQNLTMELNIKLTDAILGTEHTIKSLDGDITLKIPPGINYGEILRIKEHGVPGKGKRGDLLVRVTFKTPAKLSKKEKEIIEKLKEEGI